jgi:asparagine synthase (glutamine-hydrolysing)
MCGVAGFIDRQSSAEQHLLAKVKLMTDAIVLRGPDDSGAWLCAENGVALGHRRLSIVDLSQEGHQPMTSACGRYVIVFNGEIYNYREIRRELEKLGAAPSWRGHSDTEIMLAAFSCWGIEQALKRFVGMFAFALWDRKDRMLHLARDRMGEKPLFYGWTGNVFLFGSELKALCAHPAWRGEIDREVLALFLRHNYVPGPYSIYKNIYKLQPGCFLSVPTRMSGTVLPTPRVFWSVREAVTAGISNPFTGTETEAINELESILKSAVGMQMVADVPLGAFLSGGIDSSTVVALMQAQSSRPVKTFTIGFHEEAYDEAKHAKEVARHLGTDHTELYVTPEEAMAVIPKMPLLYDEPFSDSSQIPTFLVSQLARRHVTVSLSGDGGDELFCGYHRYFWGRKIWRNIGWMPRSVRFGLTKGITSISPAAWERAFRSFGKFLPEKLRKHNLGDKMHKLSEILAVSHPEEMYLCLVSHWKTPASVVLGVKEPLTVLTDENQWLHLPTFTHRMMYLDTITYLPDDILVKVDRASMGVSLESRVPFLDHRLVEFAWRLPLSMKIHNGRGKWLLKKLLCKYIPVEFIERPKMGFGVPIDMWLRGPLRDWAESLLDENKLKAQGFFDPCPIRVKWDEHMSGKRNWQYYLWDVLMFQAWLDARPS